MSGGVISAGEAVQRAGNGWWKWIAGGGLGAVLAWQGSQFFMQESKSNTEFMRTTVKDNTMALSKVESAITAHTKAIEVQTDRVTDSIDELAEATTKAVAHGDEMGKRIDRLLQQGWNNARGANAEAEASK